MMAVLRYGGIQGRSSHPRKAKRAGGKMGNKNSNRGKVRLQCNTAASSIRHSYRVRASFFIYIFFYTKPGVNFLFTSFETRSTAFAKNGMIQSEMERRRKEEEETGN